MPRPDPRLAAIELLHLVLAKERPLEDALNKTQTFDTLTGADRGFARAMVSTALRQLGRIDAGLSPLLDRPLEAASPEVQAALRIGAAQIWCLDVSPHAAVSETVRAVKNLRNGQRAAGFINAVLRRAAREPEAYQAASPLAVWPDWLRVRMVKSLGEATASGVARAQLDEPETYITGGGDPRGLAALIGSETVKGHCVGTDGRMIEALPGYASGAWWVQDPAAALPALLLRPQAGDRIADLCAAPGGKTMQLAANGADVVAVDRSRPRLERMHENLQRTGLANKVSVLTEDVETWQPGTFFDKILLDAPCSALGTLRRNPEGAWIKSPDSIRRFPDVQARFLRAALNMLTPGGQLVYCVCSPLSAEGLEIIQAACADEVCAIDPILPREAPDFEWAVRADGLLLTVQPEQGQHDAFFMARLVKP